MPSLDIVSKIDLQEVDNAVNSVLRELTNRYDFKGAKFTIELKKSENLIEINAPDEYKLKAIQESLKVYATKRSIDVKSLEFCEPQNASNNSFRQEVKIKNGIDQESAKKIVKQVKNSKLKIQASIRGDEVRLEGKKRDDLQQAMSIVKAQSSDIALQFINFRD
jgi:cyclic-di-GMP-binding protein|tara:strand:+ start:15776 stop:16267 length:492 start_codon:yes stop_codon:yes gene_type:complete